MIGSIGAFTDGVLTESGTRLSAKERTALVLQLEDADQLLDLDQKERLGAEIDAVTGGNLEQIAAEAGASGARNAMDIMAGFILLGLLVAAFLPRGRLAEPHPEPPPGLLPDRRAGPSPGRGT